MIGNFLWGIAGIALSFAMIKWRMKIRDFVGESDFTRKFGGTHLIIVLIAIAVFFAAVTKMTGKWDDYFSGAILEQPAENSQN